MTGSIALAQLDVDGTLRDHRGWKPGALDLLDRLRAADVPVALCSGRNSESLHGLAEEHDGIGYVAAGSGALVQERTDEGWTTLAARYLDVATVGWIHDLAAGEAMELWAYTDAAWLVETVNSRVEAEAELVGASPTVSGLTGRDDIVKVLAFPLTSRHRRLLDLVDAQRDLYVAQSNPGFFDIVRAEAGIGKGGDVLIDHLGLTWEQVMAAGDGENDLGMLSRVGVALAMAPMRIDLLDAGEAGARRYDCRDLSQALARLTDLGIG